MEWNENTYVDKIIDFTVKHCRILDFFTSSLRTLWSSEIRKCEFENGGQRHELSTIEIVEIALIKTFGYLTIYLMMDCIEFCQSYIMHKRFATQWYRIALWNGQETYCPYWVILKSTGAPCSPILVLIVSDDFQQIVICQQGQRLLPVLKHVTHGHVLLYSFPFCSPSGHILTAY